MFHMKHSAIAGSFFVNIFALFMTFSYRAVIEKSSAFPTNLKYVPHETSPLLLQLYCSPAYIFPANFTIFLR